MKQGAVYFYCVLMSMSFLQCHRPRLAMSRKDGHLVKQLLIFPVHSQIDIIEQRDKRVVSGIFSAASETGIKKELDHYIPSGIHTAYLNCGGKQEEEIRNAGIQLVKTVKRAAFVKKVEPPDLLLKMLDSLKEDYGLLVFHGGFTRTSSNFRTEYARRRTLAVASLGLYNTEPNETYSVMIGMVINKRTKRVSLYKELYWRNRDPNETVVIRSQIRDIILSYFQASK